MPLPIKIVFTDEAWKTVKKDIESTKTFEDLRPLIKRKDFDKSLTVINALRVSLFNDSCFR